jgi:response regulator of citrate/malate metabolism
MTSKLLLVSESDKHEYTERRNGMEGEHQERTVVDHRQHPFIMVTKEVIENDEVLSKPVDLAVYVVLCMYADNRTKEAYPSVATIAKKSRSSERVVRRSIKSLEEAGYIEIKRQFGEQGRQTSNQYILGERRK